MTKQAIIALILIVVAVLPSPKDRSKIQIASKKFTESVILGEMLRILAESEGESVRHLREVGGTRIVFQALQSGEIDVYPEYTGTLSRELFSGQNIQTDDQLREALGKLGIRMSRPLGFNNTYAIGMLKDRAAQSNIQRISDLAGNSSLKYGFTSEFMERGDGWPGLKTAYGLAPDKVEGLDHDIAYQQLELGVIDVIDVYTTDARIKTLGIQTLKDDRNYFPRYDAVILYREDTASQYPETVKALLRLEGRITEPDMVTCNGRVELDDQSETQVAADFVRETLGVTTVVSDPSRSQRIVTRTIEHLELVRRSLLPAILVGIPLGIIASRSRWFGQIILGGTGIVQTIPALALLVLIMPMMAFLNVESIGAGSATAIVALFLYSLLPIVRNTHTGLSNVNPALIESAQVLNLPAWHRLLEIELPLASREILAGIKTAAVLNVGFATLGALVAAGGYGQPILSGIRLADTRLILEGAVPAALLALLIQGAFELVELIVVPRGLRLKPADAAAA